ncbi:GDSL esterase/lipase [Panicum miliaceum]|uniref:GDSL esterase/lipase n=1 Tax=Panicum miliaceum TaxID=4540 RepID=A0A3L6TC89_PANMI|nr:GDSL esterase/lipase [Panicum miliaceum]
MVRGTYVMESDRTKHRLGTCRALAPPWWESFGFRLRDVLDCDCDCVFCRDRFNFGAQRWSIYGAILEHVHAAAGEFRRHPSAPRYIVAFRGTMSPSHRGDTHANVELLLNRQHGCRRFLDARRKVGELLDYSIAYYGYDAGGSGGGGAVWLAGHSLGASIALDLGRHMMTDDRQRNLPTFLFNPPQVSVAPLLNALRVPDVARRFLFRVSCTVKEKLGAATALRPLERKMEELFERLAPWAPELYVHERDIICRGFIDYFEQRQNMLVDGSSQQVALHGTKLSLRDMLLFLHADNKEGKQVQPHLLPSARLWKTSVQGHRHGLQQWLEPDWILNLRPRLYSYPGA